MTKLVQVGKWKENLWSNKNVQDKEKEKKRQKTDTALSVKLEKKIP